MATATEGVSQQPLALDLSARTRHDLFAVGLAAAALFHLAGNPRFGFVGIDTALALVQVAVGIAAVLVSLRPRTTFPLLALCTLIPVSAWLEAPNVGNHWLLAALLGLGYLLAAGSAWQRGGERRVERIALFVPSGRVILLLAYGFAAFAKLNRDFFDPVLSCAVFYQDQLVSSWGVEGLSVAGDPAMGLAVAVGAAALELSVPALLALRRTRRAGLVVGLAFHWLLALDLHQHFWDFSSVLFVGFLLFLDEAQLHELRTTAQRLWASVRRPVQLLLASAVVAAGTLAAAAAALPDARDLQGAAVSVGHLTWLLAGTAVLVAVVAATARTHPVPQRLTLPLPLLWIVPLLVALNGVSPYLELKTGFGWQMYSNLRTVDGETNHLLVPATLDLTGQQADRVEILSASDPSLDSLAGRGYEVVVSELREYAHSNPDEAVTYRRDGVVHDVERIGQDLSLGTEASIVSRRLQVYRVVDASGGERCLAAFSPAR